MATVVKSMSVQGIEGFCIEVEATTIKGQQQMISIIGLGDQAVKEAGERIQAALEFCGYSIPKDKVIVPYENWKEAESVTGIEVVGVQTLREAVLFCIGSGRRT